MKQPLKRIKKNEAKSKPFLIWNAFIDLLASRDYDDLGEKQRPAHLVFWYESEVQNGGHLQYFENRNVDHVQETIEALRLLGAECQAEVLEGAARAFLSQSRPPIRTVEEYVTTALEGEFDEFDRAFSKCSPNLNHWLERHLDEHQADFVLLTD